jgi:hypothetical protein
MVTDQKDFVVAASQDQVVKVLLLTARFTKTDKFL